MLKTPHTPSRWARPLMSDDNDTSRNRRASITALTHETGTPARRLNTLIVILSVASLTSITPSIFHPAYAAGIVYVNHPTTVVASVGTVVTVRVQVAGVDPFTGWDIQVQSNASVINPTSLSIKGNTLAVNYSETVVETMNCVNGASYNGSHCDPSEGPGIVHSTATGQQDHPPSGPVDGLLFTINYTVIRTGSYSPLQILRAIITNNGNPVPVTTHDGVYGIPPGQGFSLTASPNSARILIGSKTNITLTIASSGGYSGTIDLTRETSTPGIMLSLNATSTPLPPNHSSNVTLTIRADPNYQPSQYTITVTATSDGISHIATVSILTTDTPDFTIDAAPSILQIHSNNSGRSTITLDTQSGFSGSIQLSVTWPGIPGLSVSLGARNLMISPGRPATTVLDIRTPESAIPFVYLVNITARSPSSSDTLTVVVKPPAPDFSFLLGSTEFVVQAGQSLTSTLTMTSIDYFKGHLHLSASYAFGAEEVLSPPDILLDFGNSSTSTMTLTTDMNSAPGVHNVTLTAVGTTFLGASVTHIIVLIVTITRVSPSKTILGLQPLTFFGLIGALSLAAVVATVGGIRKFKHARI